MKYILLLAISAFILAACNTTEGVGRDIQKAGQGIQKGAQKAKPGGR